MNVQALIDNAIYLSLQDREHQPQINTGYETLGLSILNSILDEWRDKLPFAQLFTFDNYSQLTATQFWSVSNVNYVLNGVQWPLRQVQLNPYLTIQNVLGLTGVPQDWYWDELTQSILVYPAPSNPQYQFTVWGRVADKVNLFDLIPTNLPLFYVDALTYELAFRLCGNYGAPFSAYNEETRERLLKLINNKKNIDLSTPISSVFGRPDSGGTAPFPWFYYSSGGSQ